MVARGSYLREKVHGIEREGVTAIDFEIEIIEKKRERARHFD